jgi:hypothetical protein
VAIAAPRSVCLLEPVPHQFAAGAAAAVLGSDGEAGDLGGGQRPAAPPNPVVASEQQPDGDAVLVLEDAQLFDGRSRHGAVQRQPDSGVAERLGVLERERVVLLLSSCPVPAGHAHLLRSSLTPQRRADPRRFRC